MGEDSTSIPAFGKNLLSLSPYSRLQLTMLYEATDTKDDILMY
jgi:hypothetical protein